MVYGEYSLESPLMRRHKHLHVKENRKYIPFMPLDLALWFTLISSNYPCLEHIFMVPKVYEPLSFYYIYCNMWLLCCIFMSRKNLFLRSFYSINNENLLNIFKILAPFVRRSVTLFVSRSKYTKNAFTPRRLV